MMDRITISIHQEDNGDAINNYSTVKTDLLVYLKSTSMAQLATV